MLILPLVEPTGHPLVDRVLAGAVGLAETVAPGQVLAYYLVGSHAAGEAVPGSDVDLLMLLKPGVTARLRAGLWDVFRCLSQVSPVPLDVLLEDAAAVGWESAAALPAARLLYGADLRPHLASPGPANLRRLAVRRAHELVCEVFRVSPPVPLPLPPPDPTDLWLGLVKLGVRYPDGCERPGLRELTAAVLWPARALVLLQAGAWVATKGESLVVAYEAHVGDGWTSLVASASRRCRAEWAYRVPDDPAGRQELRTVCEGAVGFAAHFLAVSWLGSPIPSGG